MKSVPVLAALIAAVLPWSAFASELSHDFVEVGVARLHDGNASAFGIDSNFDGGYLRGSAAFGSSGFYGFGGYRQGTNDGPFGGTETSRRQAGVGYGWRVAPAVEVLGEASYLHESIGGYGVDTGRLTAGVRGQLGQRVDGWAKAHYTDETFDSTRYSGELGALVKLTDRWGITGGVELGDARKEYTVGVRASF